MSIKVGNKIIANIPEAVSFLLQEVEAIKKERVDTPVRVYEFEEGTILTDAIYEEIKAGDIISVDGKQFLVSKPLQTPRAFYGYYVSSITSTSATIIKLEWEGINALTLTSITIDPESLDFSDVDFKAKTLEQSDPNWSIDLSDISLNTSTGFTAENIFTRVQKLNQELEIVLTCKITNTTENAGAPSYVQLDSNVSIPEEIGQKIIDVLGHDLTENTGFTLTAIAGSGTVHTGSGNTQAFTSRNGILSIGHYNSNLMNITIYSLASIPAGSFVIYSGRIQLTLL